LLAVLVALLAAHAPIPVGLAAIAIGTGGVAFAGFRVFTDWMLLSNAVLSASNVLVTGALCMMLRGIADEMTRRKLRRAFGQYLSPQMVRTIEASGTEPELGGVTTDITVMFMDVRGFATLSETLSSRPQVLTTMINIILDEASTIILAHGGTVDKFIGDCVMAFWNAPLAQADHHDRAVATGIALQKHLPAINARIATEIGDVWPEISGTNISGTNISGTNNGIAIGVGMASGAAVVGNFGSRTRLSYSVVGDTVNLAARLEPFSKQSGLPLTLAAATAAGVGAHNLLKIDEIPIRGRKADEAIFSWHPLDPEIQDAHDDFLSRLLTSKGPAAKPALARALGALAVMPEYPAGLVAYYQKRIASL
jgi:adenylate cyclase